MALTRWCRFRPVEASDPLSVPPCGRAGELRLRAKLSAMTAPPSLSMPELDAATMLFPGPVRGYAGSRRSYRAVPWLSRPPHTSPTPRCSRLGCLLLALSALVQVPPCGSITSCSGWVSYGWFCGGESYCYVLWSLLLWPWLYPRPWENAHQARRRRLFVSRR